MTLKEENKALSISVIILIILVSMFASFWAFEVGYKETCPQGYTCEKPYNADKFNWCKKKMPKLNSSLIDPRISEWCYGEVWPQYCKISYPNDCPPENGTQIPECSEAKG